jgi:S1-C subfamily serine protease
MRGVKFAPLVIVALVAAAAGFFFGSSRGQTGMSPEILSATSASTVYAKANPAVRTVRSSNAQLSNFDARGVGTAFHIGGGYYVTAAHVVADGYQFYLDSGVRTVARLEDNDALTKVEVVGKDAVTDIALLKGTAAPATLAWAARDAVVGDVAYAVGNPFAIAPNSFSSGMVSGANRAIGTERGTLTGLLQIDTPVNPGNSGGPLLNAAGEIIGVVSANIAQTNQNAGVGFAVPSSKARAIIETYRSGGKLTHPSLGVFGNAAERPVLQGIQPGSNAARGGLRDGDLVLKVAGLEIESFEELNAMIANQPVGAKVALQIKRGNATQTLTLSLEAQ